MNIHIFSHHSAVSQSDLSLGNKTRTMGLLNLFLILFFVIHVRLESIFGIQICEKERQECLLLSECDGVAKVQPKLEDVCDFGDHSELKICCKRKVVRTKSSPGVKSSLPVDPPICGKSSPVGPVIGPITGGKPATLGQHPYMVFIGYRQMGEKRTSVGKSKYPKPQPIEDVQFGCGGTLINSRYVLTAAHCVKDLPSTYVPVVARIGEFNLSSNPDCFEHTCAPPMQDVPIEGTTHHEEYDLRGTTENDIALIKLSKDVEFGEFQSPVCLSSGMKEGEVRNTSDEFPVWVVGWGRTKPDDESNSDILQEAWVPMQPNSKCKEVYGDISMDGRFCAGGKYGMDSCRGDSGGPLLVTMKAKSAAWENRRFQLGVVSKGPSDCGLGPKKAKAIPALYTNVTYFIPWILKHMK